MQENIKITIITVCFNAENKIEKTIQSVINQNYTNLEYILIDGNSQDNTINIIKRYSDKIDLIISEKDKGIYDAMNKGIKYAKGDLINFMNAGDSFHSNTTITDFVTRINQNKIADIYYGDVVYMENNQQRLHPAANLNKMIYEMTFCHQCAFVSSKNLKNNNFSLKYKLASDYHFFLKMYLEKKEFIHIPIIIANEEADDGVTYKNFIKSKRECICIHKEYGFNVFFRLFCFFKIIIRYYIKDRIK